MKNSKLLVMLAAAATLVAACNDRNGDGTPMTTTQIVSDEISANTSDGAAPIMLNDLPISNADTDDTSLPIPVI
ncbi:MAG: hypothetical protein M3O62_03035 [Pseudomonadota bacterium]|nr:hypothetical protein [Pseudomonadota bacterium]